MNCENKRKTFEKGYYKNHACKEVFVCKNCGRTVIPEGAGSAHRNHCPNCPIRVRRESSRSASCEQDRKAPLRRQTSTVLFHALKIA